MKVKKSQTLSSSSVESDNEDDSSISEGLDPIPIGNNWSEKDIQGVNTRIYRLKIKIEALCTKRRYAEMKKNYAQNDAIEYDIEVLNIRLATYQSMVHQHQFD